jgi:hypothetical protein
MVAGLLSVVIGILSIPLFIEEGSESARWYVLESVRWAFLALGVEGLYRYLRHSRRFGRTGMVGFGLLLVVSVANAIINLVFALTQGAGAQWLDARFGPVQALGTIFGVLLLGIGILRTGRLQRAGAWLWVLAALAYLVIIVGIITGVAPIYNWGFFVADALFGSGCLVLGYELWSHRNQPLHAARQAR